MILKVRLHKPVKLWSEIFAMFPAVRRIIPGVIVTGEQYKNDIVSKMSIQQNIVDFELDGKQRLTEAQFEFLQQCEYALSFVKPAHEYTDEEITALEEYE